MTISYNLTGSAAGLNEFDNHAAALEGLKLLIPSEFCKTFFRLSARSSTIPEWDTNREINGQK